MVKRYIGEASEPGGELRSQAAAHSPRPPPLLPNFTSKRKGRASSEDNRKQEEMREKNLQKQRRRRLELRTN